MNGMHVCFLSCTATIEDCQGSEVAGRNATAILVCAQRLLRRCREDVHTDRQNNSAKFQFMQEWIADPSWGSMRLTEEHIRTRAQTPLTPLSEVATLLDMCV